MSTEQQVVYGVTEAGAERPRRAVSATALWANTRIWSLADQAAVSLGNFLTNVILARNLAPHDFGVYAILFGVMLFIYGAHSALVAYPLSIRGATASKDGLVQLTTFSLWLTTAVGFVLSVALVVVCFFLGHFTLGLCCAAAMFSLIIQETLRRALMAHLRFRDSFVGDSLSYLGQVAIVLLLASIGSLSINTAFLAMAATSLAAAGLQIIQLEVWSARITHASLFFVDFWKLGRWMLLNSIAGIFSAQLFPWILALVRGASLAGVFQALTGVVSVTNPIVLSTVSLLLPASAKASMEHGKEKASRVATRYAFQGAALVFPYLFVAGLWPRFVLKLLYGSQSPYGGYANQLRLLAAAYCVLYISVMLAAILNAFEESRTNFIVLLVSAVVSVVVGIPLMIWLGLFGAIVTMAIGILIRTGMLFVAVRRHGRDLPGEQLQSGLIS
jgi:O-antigen/teichoic acid export membrane protein